MAQHGGQSVAEAMKTYPLRDSDLLQWSRQPKTIRRIAVDSIAPTVSFSSSIVDVRISFTNGTLPSAGDGIQLRAKLMPDRMTE